MSAISSNLSQSKYQIFHDLHAFLGLKFGLKDLVCIKNLHFATLHLYENKVFIYFFEDKKELVIYYNENYDISDIHL